MLSPLLRHLFWEQGAFLRRDRSQWEPHLTHARGWVGKALKEADPGRPVLLLGAGWGLEIPWSQAPPQAVGWDADPLSRIGTCLRHRRWAPWVFEDLCGDSAELAAMAQRCVREPWNGKRRSLAQAIHRLAGLIPSLEAFGTPLRTWIQAHRPGLIVSANVMGQWDAVVHALVRKAFHPLSPFVDDPEAHDPLTEALEGYVVKAVRHHLEILGESGAELCLLYDRAVFFDPPELKLGVWTEEWRHQLRTVEELEARDPLMGVDPGVMLGNLHAVAQERWLWPVGPQQLHLMEARRFRPA